MITPYQTSMCGLTLGVLSGCSPSAVCDDLGRVLSENEIIERSKRIEFRRGAFRHGYSDIESFLGADIRVNAVEKTKPFDYGVHFVDFTYRMAEPSETGDTYYQVLLYTDGCVSHADRSGTPIPASTAETIYQTSKREDAE